MKYFPVSPDGFPFHPEETFEDRLDAIIALANYCKRYKAQGYYSSPTHGRIPYVDIIDYCTLEETQEEDEMEFEQLAF